MALRSGSPLLIALAVAAGCSTTSDTPDADTTKCAADSARPCASDVAQTDATEMDAPADVLHAPPITRTMTEAQLAPMRRSCAFNAGAWPAQTLGTEYPVGDDIPINHVVIIIQENRSFDNYLGRLVAQGYYQPGDFSSQPDGGVGSGFAHSEQVDTPPEGWSQPDGHGGTVAPHPDGEFCFGVNHSWNDMHDDYNHGAMDHFVTNNNPNGQRSISYVDDTVIPFYYALANDFAIGDRYFASVMSSTWPNRLYAMAGTSFGLGDNSLVTTDTPDTPAAHIFASLDAAGRTWKDYTDGPHQVSFFLNYGFRSSNIARFRNVRCDLFRDIQNNTLPDVAYIMGDEVTGTSDEGPSALPGIGGQLVENIIRALWASPAWQDTAVFITYDENGGMADHVPPAPACPPDNLLPHLGNGTVLEGDFRLTGFRVPFILVSPFARRHFVSHLVYDHTSMLRFIEARFGLPALTARDANATPPMEMFDFQSPPHRTPPMVNAHTTVPQAVLDRCRQNYAPWGC